MRFAAGVHIQVFMVQMKITHVITHIHILEKIYLFQKIEDILEINYGRNKQIDIEIELIARDDIDVVDIFQIEHHIKKGGSVKGILRRINDDLSIIRIEFIKGQETFYVLDVVEKWFDVKIEKGVIN